MCLIVVPRSAISTASGSDRRRARGDSPAPAPPRSSAWRRRHRDQSPDLSRNRLLAIAAAYVTTYQQQFAFLIADETTVQEAFGVKDPLQVPLGARTTRGEIFLTFLTGTGIGRPSATSPKWTACASWTGWTCRPCSAARTPMPSRAGFLR